MWWFIALVVLGYFGYKFTAAATPPTATATSAASASASASATSTTATPAPTSSTTATKTATPAPATKSSTTTTSTPSKSVSISTPSKLAASKSTSALLSSSTRDDSTSSSSSGSRSALFRQVSDSRINSAVHEVDTDEESTSSSSSITSIKKTTTSSDISIETCPPSPSPSPSPSPLPSIQHEKTTSLCTPSPSGGHSRSPSLESLSPGPTPNNAAEQTAQDLKRSRVISEIITSESSYVSGLKVLIDVYMKPLAQKVAKGSAKLDKIDYEHLFSNVEQIHSIHTPMLNEMEVAVKHPERGESVVTVFSKYAPYLKMYTQYVSSYDACLGTLNKLDKNSEWKKFLKQKREDPQTKHQDITSFLILPIQRIPRYELLFRELLRSTPSQHIELGKLQELLSKINVIAKHVNEQKRRVENASILLEIQNRIHGELPEPLFLPARRFIRSESMKHLGGGNKKGEKVHVILFNDVIVWTDIEHNYKGWINLIEISAAKSKDNDRIIEFQKTKAILKRPAPAMVLEAETASVADGFVVDVATCSKELLDPTHLRNEPEHARRISMTTNIQNALWDVNSKIHSR